MFFSLVKDIDENDCQHLRQELDSEVLDLVTQIGFYPYEHMCDFVNEILNLIKDYLAKTSVIVN